MKYLKYLFLIPGIQLSDTGLSVREIPDYLSSNSDAKIIIFFRLR